MASRLSQAKILGGTGSILLLLSIVPVVGFVLGIIGFILVLVAVKQISVSISVSSVFHNMIISAVLGIVALLVLELALLRGISRAVNYVRDVSSGAPHPAIHFGALILVLIIGLIVVWVLYLMSGYFLRKSFNVIAQRLNVGLFKTGATVFFIGAALTIIFVGFLVILVAEILFAIAFFSLPDEMISASPSGAMPPPGQSSVEVPAGASSQKLCSKCGARLSEDTIFCPSCGQKQS